MQLHVLALAAAVLGTDACAQPQRTEGLRTVRIALETAGPSQSPPAPVSTDTNDAPARVTRSPSEVSADARVVAVEPGEPGGPGRSRRGTTSYSSEQLIILGLSADSTELTRSVIIDPRLIRAEAPFGQGDSSARLYRQSVEFPVRIDDPRVVAIRILRPVWDGREWTFDVIAEAPLGP